MAKVQLFEARCPSRARQQMLGASLMMVTAAVLRNGMWFLRSKTGIAAAVAAVAIVTMQGVVFFKR